MAAVILCGIGLALGHFQNVQRDQGRLDFVTQAAQTVVSPASQATRHAVGGVQDFGYGFLNSGRLTRENRELRAVAASLSQYAERERLLCDDIDRLRKSVGMPVHGRKRVFADTVGFAPHENRLSIAVGSSKGVRAGMPVVCSFGLVGVVQTVEKSRSQVLLVSSPALKVGAMTETNPGVAGLVRGENPTQLIMDIIDEHAPVQVGDWVVTSGYGERIPRGIRLGRVVEISHDPEFGSTRALIAPSVNVCGVQEVFVLL